MKFSMPDLLRRTIFAAGAFAVLALAAVPTQAQQTVNLVGQTTLGTCVFSGSLTVLPNGALQVTCAAGGGGLTGSVFSVSVPTTSPITVNSTTSALVMRSGGTGSASVNYSVIGAGCVSAQGTLTFADTTPQPITVTTSATPGACTVTISPSAGDSASVPSASFNVVDAGGGGPPGCPAVPVGSNTNALVNGQVVQLRMISGQIATFPVIPPQDSSVVSNVINQGQQPASPPGAITEISVSKCPGVIDTSVPQCYLRGTSVNNNQLPIYTGPRFTWTDQATLGGRGCWAGDPGVQYYVSIRWTFSSCQFTAVGGCGFSEQWTNGPW